MSPTPEESSKPVNDSQDLAAQIASKRQQIAALEHELKELEQRQRDFSRMDRRLDNPAPPEVQRKHPAWGPVIGLAASLALAIGGQLILLKTNSEMPTEGIRQILAGAMLISGALWFGVLASRLSGFRRQLDLPFTERNESLWDDRARGGWLVAAMGLFFVAISLFIWKGETTSVVMIWLASLVALLVSQVWGLRFRLPHVPVQERTYLILLAGLLVIALATRIYKLTTLPYNVDGDFASVGLQARALAAGQQQQIFAFGWAGVPILGYLPPWLTMKLFGTGLAGLNASGVLEGLLIIVGMYLLGRDLFHVRVGLIAAALVTISYAHLAASRQSSYIDPVAFLIFAIYFLLMGLREERRWAVVVSAILTALCLQMYYSGRIIIFLIAFMLLFLGIFHRSWLRSRGGLLALWFLGILIAFGPMLVVFAREPETLASHTRSVFILDPDVIKHMQGVYQVDTLSAMLLQQMRHSVLFFHYYGDTGTQFGFKRPFLDPVTAILFTLGLGYALFQWRHIGNSLLLAWTALGVLLGCFLTVNPPFWARLMILLPAATLLAALALNLIYEQIVWIFQPVGSLNTWIAAVLVVVLIGWAGIQNWKTYVELKGTLATPRTRIGRYLAEQPPSLQAYLISSDYNFQDREFEFLAPQHLIANLTAEQLNDKSISLDPSKIIIVTPEQVSALSLLKQRFPKGTVESHAGNPPDEIAFFVFRIP